MTEHLKIPPHSLQAEQAVIGGVLIDPKAASRVCDILTPEDFYRRDHQVIWRAVTRLADRGRPVDMLTVDELLGDDSGEVGGKAYLGELAMNTPGASNIRHYAQIVVDRSRRRQVISAAMKIAESAYGTEQPAESLLADAQGALLQIGGDAGSGPALLRQYMGDWVEMVESRTNSVDGITGLHTGYRDFDRRTTGLHAGQLVVVAGRPGMGKAQPLDSKVLLSDGSWKQMGDIKVGDCLASTDGRESQVSGVFPQGFRPIYRVTLSDGRAVEADAEHIWSITSSRFKGTRKLTTIELADLLEKKRYSRRVRLTPHSGNFGSRWGESVDPWLLGFLLGDGCLTRSGLTFANPEPYIHERVAQATGMEIHGGAAAGCTYQIFHAYGGVPHPVRESLARLGVMGFLAHEKSVPAAVFRSEKETRRAVLAGLLESDGWVEAFNSVQFSSSSEELADGLIALVRSLAGSATKRVKRSRTYSYKGEIRKGRDAYVVTVALDDLAEFIRSPRLLANLRPRNKPAAPVVTAVEFVRNDYAQCISVSHGSHLYITDDYTVTHNTSWGTGIAANAAKAGKTVLVFSMEMSGPEIVERTMAAETRVDLHAMRAAQMDRAQWKTLLDATGRVKQWPLLVDETPALRIAQIRARARRVKHKHGLDLVVVDYLSLAQGEGDNRVNQVGDVSRGLKALAKELQVPVIALSQLNRNLEQRADKRPMISDLRETGQVEQDADVIVFLYRDEVYDADSPAKNLAEVNIAKQRNGATGMFPMVFLPHIAAYVDAEPGTQIPRSNVTPIRRGGGFGDL